MLDTAHQKVENLTKEADTLLAKPPQISVVKEDIRPAQPRIANIPKTDERWRLARAFVEGPAVTPARNIHTIVKPSPNFPIRDPVKSNEFLTSPTASFNSFKEM